MVEAASARMRCIFMEADRSLKRAMWQTWFVEKRIRHRESGESSESFQKSRIRLRLLILGIRSIREIRGAFLFF